MPLVRELREALRVVIFEHDTRAGRVFDVALIVAILISVAVVMLDSVRSVSARWGTWLWGTELFFTLLFTVEYLLRLWTAGGARRYAFSFFGVVDLIAILPTYLALVLPVSRFLAVVRILRVLRIFRILKLTAYLGEATLIAGALRRSRRKIGVFILSVLVVVVVIGSLMYLLEGPEAGFTSIPRSIYWAIVTLTTVGYGDITPVTPLGQAVAGALMLLGYGIIAVPTGIVTVEIQRAGRPAAAPAPVCPSCGAGPHDADAAYCKRCGATLATGAAGAPSP